MPNRLMIQCTLKNGEKGMVSPTVLKWELQQRANAELVLSRYNATAYQNADGTPRNR